MRQFISTFVVFRLLTGMLLCPQASADDYYYLSLKDVTLTAGSWPSTTTGKEAQWPRHWMEIKYLQPYAVGQAGEEMYLSNLSEREIWRESFSTLLASTHLAIQTASGKPPSGRIFFPKDDHSGMSYVDFTVSQAPKEQDSAKSHFLEVKKDHYDNLWRHRLPGSAWFRHQVEEVNKQQGKTTPGTGEESNRPIRPDEFDQTYSLFTGGRAVSENLQLDRALWNIKPTTETVPLDSIEGITTTAYDWSKYLKGVKPALDPLATAIPADQHALFFPSFQAMLDMMDETEKQGTPVYGLVETRAENARTRARYERQLCLAPDILSRVLGPSLVSSTALTGSDPYLRTGSDVAVLFEAPNPALLQLALIARHNAARANGAEVHSVSGTVRGVSYTGVDSPERRVCSYMATVGQVVVVSNSLYQLERILTTAQGGTPSMASLDEYAFFRGRYPRGHKDETALLMVTDGAIRRWCGPRWRIYSSRRTRAAAALSEIQAASLVQIASGISGPGVQLPAQLKGLKNQQDGLGAVSVSGDGVTSSVYGNLEFLTPIAELPGDTVTTGEKQSYEWFRTHYQQNWRRFFDPIAIRFTVSGERLAADLSIRPLIAGTEYRDLTGIAGAPQDLPDATEFCANPLLQLSFSFDSKAERLNRDLGMILSPGSALARIGFSWLGNWITLIAGESGFWEQLGQVQDTKGETAAWDFLVKNHQLVPLSVVFDVGNSLTLTAFLPALRGMIEGTAPGMTSWETITENDRSYVRISVRDATGEWTPTLHYAVTPKRLILSLNEDLLKSEMSYVMGATTETKSTPHTQKNPSNMEIHMSQGALTILDLLSRDSLESVRRERSWGNLPILNEWHRLAPKKSAVDFHEHFWYTRLTCPGGGEYVWNDEFKTYESTVYGHPGQPKVRSDAPSLLQAFEKINTSLVFEEDGLRGRCDIIKKDIK